jgi:hypothetical protein
VNKIDHSSLSSIADEHFQFVCLRLKRPTAKSAYKTGSVKRKLEDLLDNAYKRSKSKPLIKYLDTNFIDILKGDVPTLGKHIKKINNLIKSKGINLKPKSKTFKDIAKCFNYKAYVKKSIPYEILGKLAVDACPYCNRQFINTYYSKKGKTRATLDHFYAQSVYPYLAISFFNLIPSCYSCNSSIKRNKKFSIITHVHPFESSFDGVVAFTIDYKEVPGPVNNRKASVKYIAEFYSDTEFMKIRFRQLKKTKTADYYRAMRNIDDLHLKELYAFHKDFVLELLQKNVIYGSSGYAKNIANQFPQIFSSEHDVLKMALGNFILPTEFNKRPFSRLTRDISAELGLLKRIQ